MNDLINKITLGDCLEVMKRIPDKSVDLVLTDPPYGIGNKFTSNFGLERVKAQGLLALNTI